MASNDVVTVELGVDGRLAVGEPVENVVEKWTSDPLNVSVNQGDQTTETQSPSSIMIPSTPASSPEPRDAYWAS